MPKRSTNSEKPNMDEIIQRVHEAGKSVIAAQANDVDQKARFPKEGIDALRKLQLMSAYVPNELGGMGLNIVEISKICEVLGLYCGSTAMIFAMHQIQVACLVHHGLGSNYIREYLKKLVKEQRLVASATTEIGTGGDLRSSICAVEVAGDKFTVAKKAPVISYGVDADDIMVTCRRTPDSPASDQVHILCHKGQYTLKAMNGWDTLGFRGTCSSGFELSASGHVDQIDPIPFSEILSQTMHPYAHIVWSSLWLGIASDAVNLARAFVRNEARRNPNTPPVSSLRLGEVDAVLQSMRNDIYYQAMEYCKILESGDKIAFESFGFAIHTNNLKLNSSRLVVDIVGRALLICGISGYRNDSKFSLSRHLRDAYGAALMVNNDRIMNHNATMLMIHRE